MPDASPFNGAVDNRGLFADHYLEERFPERDDVRALQDEADAAFDEVRALYDDVASEVDTWNEAQTEDNFVQPVLKDILGWARKVQPHLQRQGQSGRPDYALFTSDERRTTAVDRAGDDETKVFDYADALAEAKYWERPLDGKAPEPGREKTAQMRRNNPSFQILNYFSLARVDWGILTNGAHWRLYYEGAPSKLETYFEVDLPKIMRLAEGDENDRETARVAFRLFYALFRAESFRPSPTVDGENFVDVVYEASDTYAEDLEDTLKERVFDHVFLELATGLYENHHRKNGTGEPEAVLDEVYRATLRLLYRLLFLLYAESRGLLPLDHPGYYEHSLTHLAERAKQDMESGRTLSAKHPDFWNDLDGLFRTIDEGDPTLDVPAYNGGLFRQDHEANAFLETHEIGQRYVARALVNLTAVDPADDPTGPSVDYKSLDVRQLGSIYEGLLEHRLVIGDDGTLDLRTDEGERKETGSYYTPHYVVEYIVEETLGPIVEERIERFEAAMAEIQAIHDDYPEDSPGRRAKLDAPRREALDAFLTVRVCDPAMGSGHFLVYAADYLAEQFAEVLGRFPDPNPVTERLDEIRRSILDELERQGVDIEGLDDDNEARESRPPSGLRDASLLKRLVMKRCIYGVDLNPMAVELAKLSLWLHSFTVGAPLSFLDHHLKAGNSLIGTRVDTVVKEIQADLFGNVRGEILRGTKFLQEAAFNTDATLADVEASAEAFHAYQDKMRPYKRLLDLWTAQHFGHGMGRTLVRDYAREVIDAYRNGNGALVETQGDALRAAEQLAQQKRSFHWELEFPEVFYELDPPGDRDNPGFDAVIGNPPYVRMEQFKDLKNFLRSDYEIHAERTDLYGYFIEQALDLVADERRLGYIVSNKWMRSGYGEPIRDLIEETATARQVIDFGDLPVFDATTYPLILIVSKDMNGEAEGIAARIPHLDFDDLGELVNEIGVPFTQEQLREAGWALLGNPGFNVIEKIQKDAIRLVDYVGTPPLMGIKTGLNEAFVVDEKTRDELIAADPKSEELLHPVRTGRDIRRYAMENSGAYLLYVKHGVDIDRYPAIKAHLRQYKDELQGRATDQKWFELQQPQEAYENKFKQPKIVQPDLAEDVRFHLDREGVLTTNTAYFIPDADWYLLALLNSQLANFFLASTSAEYRGGYMRLFGQYVEELPIRNIDFTTPEDEREQHVEALIGDYEAARSNDAVPSDTDVLAAVDDHLTADPERSGVVHDLLAHLAREMTRLKEDRHTYNLDITDYVATPSDDGIGLRDVGRYQPAEGVTESLLADTTEQRENLRIGRLETDWDGDTVHVRATARFKPERDRDDWPDAVPADAEPDQWGYVETEPLPVCTLHDCTEIEAGLVVHWCDALNDADSGFSSYRDTATKTISPLDRIYDARLPDPSDEAVQDALRPFLENAASAADLDRQIAFTDGLIDRVVYRLYGLSEEEITIVEET